MCKRECLGLLNNYVEPFTNVNLLLCCAYKKCLKILTKCSHKSNVNTIRTSVMVPPWNKDAPPPHTNSINRGKSITLMKNFVLFSTLVTKVHRGILINCVLTIVAGFKSYFYAIRKIEFIPGVTAKIQVDLNCQIKLEQSDETFGVLLRESIL